MPNQDYDNFDLLIEPNNDRYLAHVIYSPLGEGKTDFVLPFREGELPTYIWLPTSLYRHVRLESEGDAAVRPLAPKDFGSRLFDAVFTGKVGELFWRSLDVAQIHGKGLRIRLRLNEAPELATWPWEYLYARDHFPALSTRTPIVRYIEIDQRPQLLTVEPPLCMVAVVSNPKDVNPLQVQKEWQWLNDAIHSLQANGLVSLEPLAQATLPALQQRLSQGDVHIIHFIGHGYFDADTGQGALIFEDPSGKRHDATAEVLGALLRDHPPLRLLFLNSCQGAESGRGDLFAGMAQKLVQQGAPAVVAMQFPIGDTAAVALAQAFYAALVHEDPVDAALAAARKAVYVAGDTVQWGTPVLFSRSPDNRLLALPKGDARRIISIQPFEPETVLIPAGPFCMGSDPGPGIPDHETPQHEVVLPDFRIGKYPVTNRQYAEFIRREPQQAPPDGVSWFLRNPPAGRLDQPVVGVSWHDACAYCTWLSKQTGRIYRLPTEAEWEKAARGPQGQIYPWGNSWSEGCCNGGGTEITPVNYFPAGASLYSCLDLVGNAQQWTHTLWGSDLTKTDYPYPYQATDGREDLDAERRLFRAYRIYCGGTYRDNPSELRCSARGVAEVSSASGWRGFRVMMQLHPQE